MSRQERLKQMLREQLTSGQKIAFDRKNNVLPDLALRKTTAMKSEWWVKECLICNDSFRENDLVRICPVCGQAYHDDAAYSLRCWGKHFESDRPCINCNTYIWNGQFPAKEQILQTEIRPFPLLEEQFFSGLVDTWNIYGDAKIHIVTPDSYLIGHNCPQCRYKIRAGDKVVKCPCSDKCHVYFHNDVLRKWTCWNEWNGVEGKRYCPISSKEYKAKTIFTKLD